MAEPVSMLPPPSRHGHLEDQLWVDEQIWGHRLWDSESPWLLFSGVSERRDGQPPHGATI